MSDTKTLLEESIVADGITADITKLFETRHTLERAKIEYVSDSVPPVRTFAEEIHKGDRLFVDLTKRAQESDDSRRPAPIRPKGDSVICDLPAFISLVEGAKSNEDASPVILVSANMPKCQRDGAAARAILNANLVDGTTGHADWTLTLKTHPEPVAQAWIDLFGQEIPFQHFADLIYISGDVVVPKESQPLSLITLAARCQLDLAGSLADLLAVANGISFKGEMEETFQENANTGNQILVVADRSKAGVRVPSAVIIAWAPLPAFMIPVLVRIKYRKGSPTEGAKFTLLPINFGGAQAELAQEIHATLVQKLEDKTVPVALVPAL